LCIFEISLKKLNFSAAALKTSLTCWLNKQR
jgi:hypothetical protein